jgi:putative SOS response-associated peptidase YedK
MCYSNSSNSKNIDLSKRYKKTIKSIPELTVYYATGFAFPTWRVITKQNNVQVMNWGLIPKWFNGTNPNEIAKMTLNARTESIHEKASFKNLVNTGRCIIPSTGFFEWKHENRTKTPYFIFPTIDIVFSMAGLYDQWMNPITNELHTTYSILTCEANSFLAGIHNVKKRMPMILPMKNESSWLTGEGQIQDYLSELNNEMEAYPVDSRILLGRNPNVYGAQLKFEPINQQEFLF